MQLIRDLAHVLSPSNRRRAVWLQAGALAQVLVDAMAFGLLYLLLQNLTVDALAGSGPVGVASDLLHADTRGDLSLRLGTLIVLFFVVSSAMGIALTSAQCRLAVDSEADVAERLFESYMKAPYLRHISINSADLTRNVHNSCFEIHQNILLAVLSVVANLLTILSLVALVAVIDPVVTAIATVYFLLVALVYVRWISPKTREAGQATHAASSSALRVSNEGFRGFKTLRTSGVTDSVVASYAHERRKVAQSRYWLTYYTQLPQYYLQSAMIGGIVCFSAGVALLSVKNAEPLVGLVVATSIRLMPALYQNLSAINRIRAFQPSLRTVVADLNAAAADASLAEVSPEPLHRPVKRIELNQLRFSYPGDPLPVLNDLRLTIEHGMSVGIVGTSGAGKTTLVDLLLGLLEPDGGEILLDGVVLEAPTVAAWRDQLGYVPQEVFLRDTSIRDNVALAVSDATNDAAVWRALERAHLAAFVRNLPGQLETVVGEHGVRFSGGQRQRLGIARALFREPSVLILDEATSALDSVTEAAIADTIAKLRGDLTVITVAHRLSTIRACDLVVLLDGGRVSGQGTFDQLREQSPEFEDLARAASRGDR